MTNTESPQQTATSAIEQALQQALACHQAGQLQDAEKLYRAILQIHPNHPEANHNMGVLAVQMKQPLAGLPYFMAALDADPARGKYWLSYIDALFQAGQLEDARQVLALARQQGLQGDEVEALSARLDGGAQVAEQHNAEHQHAIKESLPVSSAASQNSKKTLKTKSAKLGKSAKNSAPHQEKTPSPQEINTLAALFNAGRYAEAATLAQTMTECFPLHGFGWMVLGAVFKQMGRSEDALAPMQKAAALLPGDANAHSNLGGALRDMGRLNEAEVSLKRALQIKPDFAEAHCNLGAALQELGRQGEAEASYRRALQIKPDYADVHNNLGVLLHDQGRLEDALAHFQQRARLTPENAVAQHLVASLTGENTERAPIGYIESVFNSYADKFDAHLQQALQYDIPKKLVELITRHPPIAEKWSILDLGCGTGLVGSAIAPFAKQLVGVDLSAKMLEKAHARKLYQRLERSDLLTMMQGEQASSYDVIIAADVFIYIGKIDEIVGEIKRLLCHGGVFAFSIETLEALSNVEAIQSDEREYQLQNTGRYAHSAKHLTRLAYANDFLIKEMVATQIRMDHGKPIYGHMGLWKS